MNTLRNKVQLIGNLGQDPEIVSFENGSKLARLNIATNEVYRNAQGDKVENVHWHRAIAWGKPADIIEKYVVKGQEIAIEGKLITRSFEDESGLRKYKTEVQISDILLLGRKNEEVTPSGSK